MEFRKSYTDVTLALKGSLRWKIRKKQTYWRNTHTVMPALCAPFPNQNPTVLTAKGRWASLGFLQTPTGAYTQGTLREDPWFCPFFISWIWCEAKILNLYQLVSKLSRNRHFPKPVTMWVFARSNGRYLDPFQNRFLGHFWAVGYRYKAVVYKWKSNNFKKQFLFFLYQAWHI